ncbi:MAG: hypothetical protein JNM07_10360 [Phycisphaerae bacterium]|nr:hypothetical protein [Phycisphaerae bacterium]
MAKNRKEVLEDVPKSKVGKTVQGFVDDDASRVVAEEQDDGKFTVTATLPASDE